MTSLQGTNSLTLRLALFAPVHKIKSVPVYAAPREPDTATDDPV